MNDLLAARWVVYPDKSRKRFYRVFVFRDVKALRAFYKEQHRIQDGDRCGEWNRVLAYARWWDALKRVKGRMVKDRCCGNVCFYVGACGAGIVSHEMTHAAHYALHGSNGGKIWFTSKKDEQFASMVGHLVNQFYRGYWKRFKK